MHQTTPIEMFNTDDWIYDDPNDECEMDDHDKIWLRDCNVTLKTSEISNTVY